jgi:hypothetical protein
MRAKKLLIRLIREVEVPQLAATRNSPFVIVRQKAGSGKGHDMT